MKKNFSHLILTFLMVFSFTTTVYADSIKLYNDVPNTIWYFDAITQVSNLGILSGTGNNNFSPDTFVTRAEFAAAISKFLKLELVESNNFNDVSSDSWYNKYVGAAFFNQLMSGYGNSNFGPLDNITREQAAVLIMKTYRKKHITTSNQSSLKFNDKEAISSWATQYVSDAHNYALISGKDGNRFDPQSYLTRAEMATLILNLSLTHPIIQLEMDNGNKMQFLLFPEHAPETVKNFVNLTQSGFYNNLTFHRIIKNFMIQGGDPLGNGLGGSTKTIKGEFSDNDFLKNKLSHTRGVISMARSQDPNSASSQFFIMHGNSNFLDGKYAAFGKLIDGENVLDEIANTPVVANPQSGELSTPNTVTKIKSITVLQ